MGKNKNLTAGIIGILGIIGYCVFYFSRTKIASLAAFDVIDFASGLGGILMLLLILRIALGAGSLIMGLVMILLIVFGMDKLEQKFGITLEMENKLFAIVGFVMVVVVIWRLVAGIKDFILEMKVEDLRRKGYDIFL